ncbi:hypothetical protein Glove_64g68 [Diversispora epigaea]|uniref:TLDc domain-containing protein n=1 Tax=Diversispora epigaea TaxID=1348612 RepID=A0A397JFE4_9GLOM|nr:hypothetical protein Glove_64g68 [Diversispora epigaea]
MDMLLTIVVAKVAGTDEIVGGYNPLSWDNSKIGALMKTNDSFIFSLKNGNIQNSILSRVINSNEALYCYNSNDQYIYGPEFGDCEFIMKSDVSDFTQDKRCRCDARYRTCYEKRIRTTIKKFSIYDYELFKIIKKTHSKLYNSIVSTSGQQKIEKDNQEMAENPNLNTTASSILKEKQK